MESKEQKIEELKQKGYNTVYIWNAEPNEEDSDHAHPFDTHLIILGGEIEIRSDVMGHRNKKQLEKKIEEAKSRKEKALAFYNLGLFHDNNARETEAIPNYLRAIKLGLEKGLRMKALAWLASSLYKTGKPEEALKRVAELIKIADKELFMFLTGLEKRIQKSMRVKK